MAVAVEGKLWACKDGLIVGVVDGFIEDAGLEVIDEVESDDVGDSDEVGIVEGSVFAGGDSLDERGGDLALGLCAGVEAFNGIDEYQEFDRGASVEGSCRVVLFVNKSRSPSLASIGAVGVSKNAGDDEENNN